MGKFKKWVNIAEEGFGDIWELQSLTDEEEATEQAKINAPLITEAKEYLANTDWYYARLAETNEPVPETVVLKRTQSRTLINELS